MTHFTAAVEHGTIVTNKVNQMWGPDMTQTITVAADSGNGGAIASKEGDACNLALAGEKRHVYPQHQINTFLLRAMKDERTPTPAPPQHQRKMLLGCRYRKLFRTRALRYLRFYQTPWIKGNEQRLACLGF